MICLVQSRKDRLCSGQIVSARLGERDPARRSRKQRDANRLLESRDYPRSGRLRNPHLSTGDREAPRTSNAGEKLQGEEAVIHSEIEFC